MITASKEELQRILSLYEETIQRLHIDISAAKAYITLLENTLRGKHPSEFLSEADEFNDVTTYSRLH